MTVLGTQKQEEKIQEMGNIAHELAPNVTVMNYKGAFRLGIRDALKKNGYSDWKELAQKTKPEKQAFFKQILENSKPRLTSSGLDTEKIKIIYTALTLKNNEYLNRK